MPNANDAAGNADTSDAAAAAAATTRPPAVGSAGTGDAGGGAPAAKPAGEAEPPVTKPAAKPAGEAEPPVTKPNDGAPPEKQPGEEPPKDKPGEDWLALRTRVAGEDEKMAKHMARYSTLEEYLKAGFEASRKIGSMQPLKEPGPDATPEEVTAYREALGVPAKPEDYKIELPDGLVMGELDKPVADEFLKVAHEHNLPPKAANAVISRILAMQDEEIKVRAALDAEQLQESIATMRAPDMWGSEADLNMAQVRQFLETSSPGITSLIEDARDSQGNLIANNPQMLQWFGTLARTFIPRTTVTPRDGLTQIQSIDAELAEHEAMMSEGFDGPWHKGPNSAKLKARNLELIKIKEDLEGKIKRR